MDTVVMLIVGCAVMAAAIYAGRGARCAVHAIMPFRDPIFITIILGEMIGLCFLHTKMVIPEEIAAIAAIFDAGYILGYFTARPKDVVFLDLPSEDLSSTEIGPFVYYVKNGRMYYMPQTLKAVFFSGFGVRHPLDMPIGSVCRSRSVKASSGFISIGTYVPLTVYPVSIHMIEELEIGIGRRRPLKDDPTPRYWFHATVQAHTVRFAQELYDDPEAFYTKSGIYRTAIERADEAVERATRLDIQMQSATFDAAAKVVAGLISLQEDAPGTKEDILEAIEKERLKRTADRRVDPPEEVEDVPYS
ncbi:hypothetical protein TALC_00375 [Thermoplasmatales archaeon BRNA1]|nr:hypothetical protein TALC_00375 [Thermoplasmatales archaeon BRNA1]